jgi:nucleoside 2-deoxyribosyltransferase
MNCFIASPLGHADVDLIFEQTILPVLSKLKVKPLRVDRVEHNEDIDDKIFELIDRSDLCIADLTYARPSVYYEAGYAFGQGKPVIYIARSDHFKPRLDDPVGNFKIHFDLQMKNIIQWTKPDRYFRHKLEKRLKYILRGLPRKDQKSKEEDTSEKIFQSLSQYQQLRQIQEKATFLLRRRGFSRNKSHRYRFGDYTLFRKVDNSTLRDIYIIPVVRLNKSTKSLFPYIFKLEISSEDRHIIKFVESLFIFVALHKIRKTSLKDLFPSWTPISDRILRAENIYYEDNIGDSATVAVLDGVQSIPEFEDKIKHLI